MQFSLHRPTKFHDDRWRHGTAASRHYRLRRTHRNSLDGAATIAAAGGDSLLSREQCEFFCRTAAVAATPCWFSPAADVSVRRVAVCNRAADNKDG